VNGHAFHEEQRLTQWWIRLIAVIVAGLGWWAFIAQIVLGEPWGNRPAPDWVVWLIFLLMGIGLPALLLFAKLTVTVTDEAVRIRWIPFAWRTIPLADIEAAEARTYRPLLEYGGWGVRWAPGRGMAWNASGDRGVQLVLASGKRILIGSQRAKELERAIRGAAGIYE
jgi:hypothetical protein